MKLAENRESQKLVKIVQHWLKTFKIGLKFISLPNCTNIRSFTFSRFQKVSKCAYLWVIDPMVTIINNHSKCLPLTYFAFGYRIKVHSNPETYSVCSQRPTLPDNYWIIVLLIANCSSLSNFEFVCFLDAPGRYWGTCWWYIFTPGY